MTKRALLRLALAALLLIAQQAAVTHAIWHAHDGLAGHDNRSNLKPGQSHDEHSSQAQFCGFDVAFGQVLGAVNGTAATFTALRLDTEALPAPDGSCRHIATVPPQSRSPPAFS